MIFWIRYVGEQKEEQMVPGSCHCLTPFYDS